MSKNKNNTQRKIIDPSTSSNPFIRMAAAKKSSSEHHQSDTPTGDLRNSGSIRGHSSTVATPTVVRRSGRGG